MKQHLMVIITLGGMALSIWLGLTARSVRASSSAVVTPSICNLSGAVIKRAGPAVGDLDKDGVNEIVVAGRDGMVYALNPDCTTVPGWPKQVNDYFVPPLVQTQSTTQDIESTPVLADVDADGWLEVIVAVGFMPQGEIGAPTSNGGAIVFEHNGSVKPGWPKVTLDRHGAGDPPWNPDGYSDGVFATPAVGDVDGDGYPEIVYGAFDKCIYVWHGDGTPVAGWWNTASNQSARCLDDTVWSSAALVDLDGDGVKDIVVGTDVHPQYKGGSVWAIKGNNTILWIAYTTQTIQSSPAVGDLNGDGYPEIVVGTGTGYPQGYLGYSDGYKVYAFDRFGNDLPGWPQATDASMSSSPALADLDKDGKLEVLIGSGTEGDFAATDRKFYVWRYNGTSFPGYPRTVNRAVPYPAGQTSAGMPYVPLVADYDNNGVLDIFLVHAGAWGVAVFPYNNPGTLDPYKFNSNFSLTAAPLISNLYNDNRLYMVVGGANSTGTNGAVYIWKLSDTNSGAQPWPMSRRDAQRTGAYPRQVALTVSNSSLYLLHQTGTTSSERASLYISNSGDDSFTWSITSKPTGVAVSPASGGPDQTLWITVTTTGKPNGLNVLGNIVISATTSGQTVLNAPQSIPVTLWVGNVKRSYVPLVTK
jgi:hypothetical protein